MRYVFWLIVFFWCGLDFYILVLKRNSYSKILDKKSKFIVIILIFLGVALADASGNFRDIWRTREFGLFQIVGTFVILTGVILRLISILTLGEYFAPDIAVKSDKKIIQKGLYKKIRHPSYTGEIIAFLGLAIVFQHIPASIYISVLPTLAFVYRAFVEEKKLAQEFGDEFIEYKKRTRMFI
jgi:protein-S-isoprenylcysteine O-methyltransferase Ste14